ncbi:hypothetical protein DEJ01_15910 [Curtobacterium sp. MCLR17_040]|uniref:hypothetical protein n=1 Tax=Curtobacterium sp. MCLR17_040 TaxID=2175625 RepID=UPI000DA9F134|nr:hypothetical protein [Curtobacterium sp. MCLR17_040]PZE98622.1 hypothetical protein DEJ01_15910 [Curtobacterium sp. MCLR17_040]
MTGAPDSMPGAVLDLDGLAGAVWLIVPLPEEVRGKPKRWANSTTYRLFPGYVRPFKSVDVIMTAGTLQNSCEMSTPGLRFGFFPPQITSPMNTTTVFVTTTDGTLVGPGPPGRKPPGGHRHGVGGDGGDLAAQSRRGVTSIGRWLATGCRN